MLVGAALVAVLIIGLVMKVFLKLLKFLIFAVIVVVVIGFIWTRFQNESGALSPATPTPSSHTRPR